jgi:hypothetical protein
VSTNQNDEFEQFMMSMCPALRRIHAKNPKKCAEVKMQMLQMLSDAEFE